MNKQEKIKITDRLYLYVKPLKVYKYKGELVSGSKRQSLINAGKLLDIDVEKEIEESFSLIFRITNLLKWAPIEDFSLFVEGCMALFQNAKTRSVSSQIADVFHKFGIGTYNRNSLNIDKLYDIDGTLVIDTKNLDISYAFFSRVSKKFVTVTHYVNKIQGYNIGFNEHQKTHISVGCKTIYKGDIEQLREFGPAFIRKCKNKSI